MKTAVPGGRWARGEGCREVPASSCSPQQGHRTRLPSGHRAPDESQRLTRPQRPAATRDVLSAALGHGWSLCAADPRTFGGPRAAASPRRSHGAVWQHQLGPLPRTTPPSRGSWAAVPRRHAAETRNRCGSLASCDPSARRQIIWYRTVLAPKRHPDSWHPPPQSYHTAGHKQSKNKRISFFKMWGKATSPPFRCF